jgi:hypothetical protein
MYTESVKIMLIAGIAAGIVIGAWVICGFLAVQWLRQLTGSK